MRVGGTGVLTVVVAESREEPSRIPVGNIVGTEHSEANVGKKNDAVHRALAGVDMNEVAIAEDIPGPGV